MNADTQGSEQPHESTGGERLPKWGEADILEAYPMIQAFARLRIVGSADADDVAHNTVEAIVRGIDEVRATTKRSFLNWCYKIAHFKVADFLRRKYNSRIVPLDPAVIFEVLLAGSESSSPMPGLKNDLDFLLELLAEVKFPCNEILVLHYIFQRNAADIVEIYELATENAARMRIERCLEAARSLARKNP